MKWKQRLSLWFETNIEWFNPGMIYVLIFIAIVIAWAIRRVNQGA